MVDPTLAGNKARLINHGVSFLVNASVEHKFCHGRVHIVIRALKDLRAGEEIFFDYGEQYNEDWKKRLEDQLLTSESTPVPLT
jgi:SET domain-containing protein